MDTVPTENQEPIMFTKLIKLEVEFLFDETAQDTPPNITNLIPLASEYSAAQDQESFTEDANGIMSLFQQLNESRNPVLCGTVGMSPMTELSITLNDSSLDSTPRSKNSVKSPPNETNNEDANQFNLSDTSTEPPTSNNSLLATNFTLNSGGRSASERRADARARGIQRRLNISPLHMTFDAAEDGGSPEKSNMGPPDELSFYAGDSPQGSPRPCSISPCMDMEGLLSPETSPSHFTIISDGVAELTNDRRSFDELDFNSMDSGYGVSANASDGRTCFKFAEPLGVAPKRVDAITPPRNGNSQNRKSSSCFRVYNSLSSDSMDSMDDDYMELLDMESMDEDVPLPSHFNSIISGDIKSSTMQRAPPLRRCLSLTDGNVVNRGDRSLIEPKTPDFIKSARVDENTATTPYSSRTPGTGVVRGFKRPEAPIISPSMNKRFKLDSNKENTNDDIAASKTMSPVRHMLRKTMSMNDANIMSALARSSSEPDLIGDFSKSFCLPLMDGRHRDLKSISSYTMAKLLRGEFGSDVASFRVVDCRYPYEFEGGHIAGAENIYTQEDIIKTLVNSKTEMAKVVPDGPKRNIIVFHCEFSSERGPKLSRFLRNHDRLNNTNVYPALHYPEIYLLHGGYKEFFESYSELCEPVCYRPMLDPSYGSAYKLFRAQTKSWSSDTKAPANRLVKSRSRLVL